MLYSINPSHPDPGQREKFNLNFYFHTSCGASKGFTKALKTFIKPLRHHKEGWKQKFKLIFILKQLSEMNGAGRVKDVL